jgi:hypothetical protein
MHAPTWIKLLLIVALLLWPRQVSAQAPCDAGLVEVLRTSLTSSTPAALTFERTGYVVLEGPQYYYALGAFSNQTLVTSQTETRVDVAAGQAVWYGTWGSGVVDVLLCMEPPPPTPTLDPSIPTPTLIPSATAVAYPAPVDPTQGPDDPTPTAVPYPPPTPLPTMLPDQTLEGLATHGHAITATAAAPVGLAILSVFFLWMGLRMLVWGRRRR